MRIITVRRNQQKFIRLRKLNFNQNCNMRIILSFILLLTTTFSFAQMRPIDKVFIEEGLVLDRETLKVIPSAILYNDSLGITTTSDENGYFKIVVPYALVKDGKFIPLSIVKSGYKRMGSGLSYHSSDADTGKLSIEGAERYNYSVTVFYMAKDGSVHSSTVGSYSSAKEGAHGTAMVQLTYKELVASEMRENKFDQLKEGNDKVYFPLGDASGLVTRLYDLIVIGKLTHVYINGRKAKLTDINKMVKRSTVFYDRSKSDSLSKTYGKETIALRTTPPPGVTEERMNATFKATLQIDLKD